MLRTRFDPSYFLVKVTAVSGSAYSFDEWWLDGAGVAAKKEAGRYGLVGANPGRAVTGATFGVGDFALCRAGEGAGGLEWELVPVGAGGGGSGITAAEVDGTPSYAGVTALRFDQADGFALSQPAAGVARVDLLPAGFDFLAGTGQDGIVTDDAQYFEGYKDHLDGAGAAHLNVAGDPLTPGSYVTGVRVGSTWDAGATGALGGNPTYADLTPSRLFIRSASAPTVGASSFTLFPQGNESVGLAPILTGGARLTLPGTGGTGAFGSPPTPPNHPPANAALLLDNGVYAITWSTGETFTPRVTQYGATGEIKPGATATGGIVTGLGTGDFGTVTEVTSPNPSSPPPGASDAGVIVTIGDPTTTPGIGIELGDIQPPSVTTPEVRQTSPAPDRVPYEVTAASGQTAYLARHLAHGGALLGGFDHLGVYRGPADFGEWTSPPPPPGPPPSPPVSPPPVSPPPPPLGGGDEPPVGELP